MSPLCRTVVGTGAILYRTRLTGLSGADAAGSAYGHVAEWLRSGLQNRLPRFNSGRGLQPSLPCSFWAWRADEAAGCRLRGNEGGRGDFGPGTAAVPARFGAFKAFAALL
jgi:hypothetical protein